MLLFSPALLLNGQEAETVNENSNKTLTELADPDIKIFPVPVLDKRFTVTSDKSFVLIKLTNIIGQEITRERYNNGRQRAEITFTKAQKGFYLVTIEFEDKTRSVKKILIDSQ
jgi:hypothetical protein